MNIGGFGAPLAESKREQMRRLQHFLVRLYFSDALQRRCAGEPDALRRELGIEPESWRGVPDVTTEAFRAECRGRRILVAREVGIRYSRSFECLVADLPPGEAERFVRITESQPFRDFVASEYFWSCRHSLPHPAGLGPGYEIVGKLFFWLEASFGLSQPDAPELLRVCAHVELGRLLVAASRTTAETFYQPLREGVCFRQRNGELDGATVVVASNLDVQVLEPGRRPAGTLLDLDEFVARLKAPRLT